MRSARRLAPVLGLLLALACASSDGESGDGDRAPSAAPPSSAATERAILPRPYTAEQIRDAWVQGLTLDMWRKGLEGEARERWTVVAADAEGVDIRYANVDTDGNVGGETRVQRSSWTELRDHATFPTDTTTREEVTRETALGMLDGWLYTVDHAETGTVTEYFFARSLPGAPVEMRMTKDDQLVMEFAQLERRIVVD